MQVRKIYKTLFLIYEKYQFWFTFSYYFGKVINKLFLYWSFQFSLFICSVISLEKTKITLPFYFLCFYWVFGKILFVKRKSWTCINYRVNLSRTFPWPNQRSTCRENMIIALIIFHFFQQFYKLMVIHCIFVYILNKFTNDIHDSFQTVL